MDRLGNNDIYKKASELFDEFINRDSDMLGVDYRGREIVKQLVRSIGSICANIEEGYGRGYGKEYVYFLKVSRGSARESKGWYWRGRKFIKKEIVQERMKVLDEIIAMLVTTINKLERN